ncbi:MAG: hypothetical protein CMM07_01930 [Rhodopirellula sp.]|nr:hypothetical protein [Rhodopirellula sp.]
MLKCEGCTNQAKQQAAERWEAAQLLGKERQERQSNRFGLNEEPQKVGVFFEFLHSLRFSSIALL